MSEAGGESRGLPPSRAADAAPDASAAPPPHRGPSAARVAYAISMLLIALIYIGNGLWQTATMVMSLQSSSLQINTGPLSILLGLGLLVGGRWARGLVLALAILMMAVGSWLMLRVLGAPPTPRMTIEPPPWLEDATLSADASLFLIALGLLGLGLWQHMTLTSRPAYAEFGLPEPPPGRERLVQRYGPPAFAAAVLIASLGRMQGMRVLEPVQHSGGTIAAVAVGATEAVAEIGGRLTRLDLDDPEGPRVLFQTGPLREPNVAEDSLLATDDREAYYLSGTRLHRFAMPPNGELVAVGEPRELPELAFVDMDLMDRRLLLAGSGERTLARFFDAQHDERSYLWALSPWGASRSLLGDYQEVVGLRGTPKRLAAGTDSVAVLSREGDVCQEWVEIYSHSLANGLQPRRHLLLPQCSAVDVAMIGERTVVLLPDGRLWRLDLGLPDDQQPAEELRLPNRQGLARAYTTLDAQGPYLYVGWRDGSIEGVEIARLGADAPLEHIGTLDVSGSRALAAAPGRLLALSGGWREKRPSTLTRIELDDGQRPRSAPRSLSRVTPIRLRLDGLQGRALDTEGYAQGVDFHATGADAWQGVAADAEPIEPLPPTLPSVELPEEIERFREARVTNPRPGQRGDGLLDRGLSDIAVVGDRVFVARGTLGVEEYRWRSRAQLLLRELFGAARVLAAGRRIDL